MTRQFGHGKRLPRGRLCAAALLIALGASLARAQQLPSQPRDYVVDLAHVIDAATAARLNSCLRELEQKTGAQLIVLTVNSTGGQPIRDYAMAAAEKWKLGRKGRDNGALVVISIKDRKWDVETGYGLEPVLTDQACGEIAREYFVPQFRQGRYAAGVYAGTLALAQRVAAHAGVQIESLRELGVRPARSNRQAARGYSLCGSIGPIVFVVLFIIILSGASRRGRYGGGSLWWQLFLLGSLTGRYGGRGRWGGGGFGGGFGGFGGGGFGGFGGGSFGGGGGGSFGGGGASGGW